MTPTRVWSLAVVGAVCAAGSWLLLRVVYSDLPPLPWTGVPALLLLAIAEGWSGRNLRARIRGRRGSKPIMPIAVARMAALAKASSLAAALVGGLAAGFLIYVSGSLDKAVPRNDAFAAASTLAAAVLLAVAALYLERGCQVRADDEDGDGLPRAP
ncbi:MAG TPA: DUF3180 domain-containing protein [Streptosporangiaceae bacterium]